jgi:catechol 2,3-dioxygenase-like lactoylglutathione lyase family enzyme
MIGYVTLGTNNKEKAEKFYDELFKELHIGRLMETEQYTAYGKDMNSPGIGVTKPFDGKPATVGNGVMVALMAENKEQVERVHAKALELGGKDEGAPGPRGEGGFYAGYFRDLDGNKLNIFCFVNN